MIIVNTTNSDNGLRNDKQYQEIIHHVQQCKDQKWRFEQDVERYILDTIDHYDWTELRHVASSLSELRSNASELIHDYVNLCSWETTKNNWSYEDEIDELSNLAYDFSRLQRYTYFEESSLPYTRFATTLKEKTEYLKPSYEYWEEYLSSNHEFTSSVIKKYENESELFSILILFDCECDGRDDDERKEFLASLYKKYWKILNKFFKDKNCRLHFGLQTGDNKIRVLVTKNEASNFQ